MENLEILVVDDEQEMLISYQKILKRAGYIVHTTQSAEEALLRLQDNHNFSLVVSDLKMPNMDGMEFLAKLKENHPHLPMIMVTGYGTLELGVEAVKNGAFDFIEKPFSSEKLLSSIQDALQQIVLVQQKKSVKEGFDNIIGKSAPMLKIFKMIQKVSYGNANILITGESGVGKELVARSVHKHSIRRNHPIIPINCGALPEPLFESELFGYEKGAFTGAFQSKPGLVELANGGTLFLDEICEMPLTLQVKLLRVLEEQKVRRIGGQKESSVNIRVVSATNRNIDLAIEKGWLREDFFYRINTIQIHIPPLRERKEDISSLIQHFLYGLDCKYNRGITSIHDQALNLLQNHQWPGNVRELHNVIERTYYLASPPAILPRDLPSYLTKHTFEDSNMEIENLPYRVAKEKVLQRFERDYLKTQLSKNEWNITQTADACGIDRRTIHRLLKKYKLKGN